MSNRPHGPYLEHEALPLQLLEIMNSGHARPADGQVRLRVAAPPPQLTIGDIAANKTKYAVPSIAIEGTRLVIHFGLLSFIIILQLSCR